jgi:DNA-binding MarR family transcriptional regulator
MSQGGRSDLDGRVAYAAKRFQQVVRSAGDRALRPLGLTMPQYAVLAVLAELPGLSNSELSRRCFVTRQTMNGLLVGLQDAGLISRAAHPLHGRVQQTRLTPAGRDAAQRGHSAVAAVEEQMTAGLTDSQESELLELMLVCIANLELDVHGARAARGD